MRLDEARTYRAIQGSPHERPYHSHPNESLIPAFEAASPMEKAKMTDAALTLLDGSDDDQCVAASFLRGIPLDAALWSRLVVAYTSGRYPETHALPRLLENASEHLSNADVAALESRFLADPRGQPARRGDRSAKEAESTRVERDGERRGSLSRSSAARACRTCDGNARTARRFRRAAALEAARSAEGNTRAHGG